MSVKIPIETSARHIHISEADFSYIELPLSKSKLISKDISNMPF